LDQKKSGILSDYRLTALSQLVLLMPDIQKYKTFTQHDFPCRTHKKIVQDFILALFEKSDL